MFTFEAIPDALEWSCSNSTIYVNETLICNLTATFSCSNITVMIDYGDGASSSLTGNGNGIES